MSAFDLYEAGELSDAIQAAIAEVKKRPTEVSSRYLLIMLLCFNGELERADRQLDLLSTQHPDSAVGAALLRQLLRAEMCRHEFLSAGRLPEFTAEPSELVKLHLKAAICQREGEHAEAAELLQTAEQQRPKLSGKCNGEPYADLRDLDDLFAPFLEALTSTGKYFWIPMSDVTSLQFTAPQSLADLLWRPVQLSVKDGPPGAIYMPTLYAGTTEETDESVRLGRATQWVGGEQSPIGGRGMRMLMVGDNAIPIMDIVRLDVEQPG